MPYSQSPIYVAFNLFLLVSIVLLMRRARLFPYKVNRGFRKIALLLSLMFVLFSFWGADWFHYLEIYPNLRNGYSAHMEDVYIFIAQNLSIGYISFRFAIWGIGLMMYYWLVRRLSVNTDLALFFFLSIWLIWFSYARVSLAMVLVYLGVTMIYKPFKYKFLSYIIGVILILSSILFHKTALFAIAIMTIAILCGLFNKRLVAVILPLFVIIIPFFISSFLSEFMTLDSYDDGILDVSVRYGQYYLDEDYSVMGLGAMLQRLLEMTPYYLLAITSYVILLRYNVEKDVALFMRMLIIIVLISSLLSIDYGLNTSVLYVRFMRFAFIPASIVLAYMWSNKIYFKLTKFIFYIAITGSFYAVIYSLYCSILAPAT